MALENLLEFTWPGLVETALMPFFGYPFPILLKCDDGIGTFLFHVPKLDEYYIHNSINFNRLIGYPYSHKTMEVWHDTFFIVMMLS